MTARAKQAETQQSPSAEPENIRARLIEGSPDCIKVLDLDGRLISMNAGGMKMLEICDIKPFIGAAWIEFWKGADREAAVAAVKTACDGNVGRFVGFFQTVTTRTPKWFDVVVSPILDLLGKPEKLVASSRDVTDFKRAERSFHAITEGTAAATGDEFFRSLARCAALALGARYAFAAETLSDLESRSLAFWEGSDFGAGFSYRFPGTPCQRVAAGHVCATPARLQEKFPEDLWLQQIAAESYVGVPMRNAQGRTLGHLAVLHTEEMHPSEQDVATLKIFASRGCAELERKQADEKLLKAHADLRRVNVETQALLNITRAIGHHLRRDVLFGALADCLQAAVPTECFGIVLPAAGNQLQGYILTKRAANSENAPPSTLERDGSAAEWVMANREWYVAASREEFRDRFSATHASMVKEKMESLCVLPLITGERVRGALFFMTSAKAAYETLQRPFLDQVASAVAVALDDCLLQEEMRRLGDELAARKIGELEQEKARLEAQNIYLQEEIRSQHNFVEIVGNSSSLLALLRQVDQVAPTDSTALIFGETGTGKELIARAIHDRSPRHERPLVKVNCGAISAGLVESELFGHVKGAFTGALTNRDGRFALADGGTIFLDEVGELPPDTQVKLLRVLQEQEFEPIGGSKTIKVDVRVIAATNRDLSAMVREGKFRSDLFYRLNVFPMSMPPLRERPKDVPLLTMFFVEKFARKLGRSVTHVSEETMSRLCAYSWPGNIRELQNLIERAVVLTTGPVLKLEVTALFDSPTAPAAADVVASRPAPVSAPLPAPGASASLEDVERQHILAVLTQTNWRIEGDGGAAKLLNLQPSTLRSRMQKLGISRRSA